MPRSRSLKQFVLALLPLFVMTSGLEAYPLQPQTAAGENKPVPVTEGVGFEQRLDAIIPRDIPFRDETGNAVTFSRYFGERPVMLAMVYYGCPNLCTAVLNGLFKALRDLPLRPGKDFDVVLVSIDPAEDASLAAEKKQAYLTRFRRDGGGNGFHFLTGGKAAIDSLAGAVGFRYRFDAASNQYAHPGGLMVLTASGRMSRYLYGVDFSVKDLRLALAEAATNRIGSLTDKFLLLCFHYDPATGRYSLAILKALKIVGLLVAAALGGSIVFMLTFERRRDLKRGGA